MNFGEKLKAVRLSKNISQSELADMTGISERSLYTYEQRGTLPRSGNLSRIADALGVSADYLLGGEGSTDAGFVDSHSGEVSALLERAATLFAGGELDVEAKELFYRSLTQVYLDSKAEAKKFAPKSRRKRAAASK